MTEIKVGDYVTYRGESFCVLAIRPEYMLDTKNVWQDWVSQWDVTVEDEEHRELVGYLLRDEDGLVFGERRADGYLAWGDRESVEPTHREYALAERAVQAKIGSSEVSKVIKVTRKVPK